MLRSFSIVLLLIIAPAITCLSQDSLKVESKDSIKVYYNSLEAGARYEYYPDFFDRTYYYIQYGRKIGQFDVFAKVLRFGINETEHYFFETEAYWKFRQKSYAYFDVAYSNSVFLPQYRLKAEIFKNYRQLEYSVGAGVVKPYQYQVIPVATGTIGYYFSNYYVYARPTFSFVDDGITKSLFLHGRRYLNDTDFLGISLLRGADTGTGRELNATLNQFGLDTYLARFSGQRKKGRYKLGAGLDYGAFLIPQRDKYMNFFGIDVNITWEF
jgi:YaiO family outer membrane protein